MIRQALVIAVLFLVNYCNGSSLELKPYADTAIVMFLHSDLDQDGHLNMSEIRETFVKYDLNGDGFETRYEYTEFICNTTPSLYPLSHYLFDEYNLNNDHVLTDEDYVAMFDNMNPNRDDYITPAEFIGYWENVCTVILLMISFSIRDKTKMAN